MCGIVGYVGGRPCEELLLAGLEKLEYRGYDSAGLSVLEDGEVESVHAVGNLANLRAAVAERAADGAGAVAVSATTGIAHTRWATHGRVTEENAHPHDDSSGKVHIVLNGIVENHAELRKRLQAEGEEFTSETDAEVVAHLIASHYDGDLAAAVRAAYAELRGHYAFVAMHADEPEPPGRRPQGVPAGRRRRRGGDLPRLGDPRLPRRHPHRGADRKRRDRRNRSRRGADHRHRRQPDRARSPKRSPGTPTPPRRAATRPSC